MQCDPNTVWAPDHCHCTSSNWPDAGHSSKWAHWVYFYLMPSWLSGAGGNFKTIVVPLPDPVRAISTVPPQRLIVPYTVARPNKGVVYFLPSVFTALNLSPHEVLTTLHQREGGNPESCHYTGWQAVPHILKNIFLLDPTHLIHVYYSLIYPL